DWPGEACGGAFEFDGEDGAALHPNVEDQADPLGRDVGDLRGPPDFARALRQRLERDRVVASMSHPGAAIRTGRLLSGSRSVRSYAFGHENPLRVEGPQGGGIRSVSNPAQP